MENNLLQEIFVSVILIILLILFLNPFNLWMPDRIVMMMVLGLIVIFIVFSSFIWKEKAQDERENVHRMFSGRIAFLAGSGILVLGIIIESFKHNLDPWLLLALGGMVLAKIAGLLHSKLNG